MRQIRKDGFDFLGAEESDGYLVAMYKIVTCRHRIKNDNIFILSVASNTASANFKLMREG